MFGVVPKTLWSRHIAPDELNRIPVGFNCYVIRTGRHTVLIETGGGDKHDAVARERMKLPPEAEPVPDVLARHGIDPESIDTVINSHLHWDHCGGNTILRDGKPHPAFPRAHYFAPRGEWEHGHLRLSRDAVSYIDANYDPLVDSGQMTLVRGDCEVVPGVWMRAAPGHTRSMMIVTAESAGQNFCFFSDLVPFAAQVPPTWVTAFDLYPLETIESKMTWLSRAAEGNWTCAFAHDPQIAFARIAASPKSRFSAEPILKP